MDERFKSHDLTVAGVKWFVESNAMILDFRTGSKIYIIAVKRSRNCVAVELYYDFRVLIDKTAN